MREHLTTWLWYRDRLCCLSSKWLVALCLACLGGLAALAIGLYRFLDDLAFLLPDNDLASALVLLELLFLASGSLWLLGCCLAALARRVVLRLRGL